MKSGRNKMGKNWNMYGKEPQKESEGIWSNGALHNFIYAREKKRHNQGTKCTEKYMLKGKERFTCWMWSFKIYVEIILLDMNCHDAIHRANVIDISKVFISVAGSPRQYVMLRTLLRDRFYLVLEIGTKIWKLITMIHCWKVLPVTSRTGILYRMYRITLELFC